MTTAEMMTAVRDLVGEDSVTATQASPTQILNFLNARMAELCADTDALVSAWRTSTVTGQSDYSVPPEYTGVQRILFKNASKGYYWLTKCPLEDLDPRFPPGTPTQFSVWGANVSGDNSMIFILSPVPDFTGPVNPNQDLECFGRQYPKIMVSGGQAPEVALREQWTVVYGAVASCFLRFAEGSPTCLALADRYTKMWELGKLEANNRIHVDIFAPVPGKDTQGYSRY